MVAKGGINDLIMLRVLLATAKRNQIIAKRAYPWSFIFGRFVGAAYTVFFSYFAYYYLYKNQVSKQFQSLVGNADYFTYAILGASLQVFAVAVLMNVGRALINEVREGTFESLILSPGSKRQYLIGNLFEQSVRATLEMLLILLLGWILGAKYIHLNILQFVFVWIIALLSLFSMGVLLGAIMLYVRDTYITQNTLFCLMNFLCGVSFPIKYLPTWTQYIAHLVPFTSTLQLYRNVIIFGKPIMDQSNLLFEICFLSIINIVIGFWWIYKNERLFIEKSFG